MRLTQLPCQHPWTPPRPPEVTPRGGTTKGAKLWACGQHREQIMEKPGHTGLFFKETLFTIRRKGSIPCQKYSWFGICSGPSISAEILFQGPCYQLPSRTWKFACHVSEQSLQLNASQGAAVPCTVGWVGAGPAASLLVTRQPR